MATPLHSFHDLPSKALNLALDLPRSIRKLILVAADGLIILFSIVIVISLRFEDGLLGEKLALYAMAIALAVPVKLAIFYAFGLYRPLLRYTGIEIVGLVFKAVILAEAGFATASFLLGIQLLPRSVYIFSAILTWVLVIIAHLLMQQAIIKYKTVSRSRYTLSRNYVQHRVIIYGAGAEGFQLLEALKQDSTYEVIALIDDDSNLHGRLLETVKIHSPALLRSLISRHQANLLLLAMPSMTQQQKRRILRALKGLPIQVKVIPTVNELVLGKVTIGQLHNIEVADLLGREEVLPNPQLLRTNITAKAVLVTGAGGSIGSELCRQIVQQQPRLLILYELNEFALYSIDAELAEKYPQIERVACLGSVTDSDRLEAIMQRHRVETVYHAAAYKHVPLVEANSAQGVLNNIYGTLVAAQAADRCQVDTFVLISTDKAVRPTNIMGTTKRVAELVLQALADRPRTHTRFIMVRFGNVLNSSGSVIPRFQKQIAVGQPITLTHPEMTRYFMSIPEAARLVLQSGAMGKGGEVFLLDMGEPVKIYDLAVQMIELSGLVPGEDIEIKITGLRPGEKLYEELLIGGDTIQTNHPKIFAAREVMIHWKILEPQLNRLFLAASYGQETEVRSLLQKLVPEYHQQVAS